MTNPYAVYNAGTNSTKVGPQLDLSNALSGSLPGSAIAPGSLPGSAIAPGSLPASALAIALDSGAWTPVVVVNNGFPVPPTSLFGQWIRVGNRVSCSFILNGVSLAAGVNSATVSLPFPRTVTTIGSAMGSAATLVNAQSFAMHGNSGSGATISLLTSNGLVSANDAISGTFVYSLV